MGQKKTLIGLNLSVFIMMLGVGMIVVLLPKKIIDFTGSDSMVGYLASAFAISYILLQVPIGNLSDKLGFKLFLFFGYLLCSATGLLFYFANSANLIFLGRIFQGAGEAPIWALAPALLSIQFPESKGKVIGIYNAAIHMGLTIGPILGIVVLKVWTGNQPFLFYAFVCFLGAVITLFSVENINKKQVIDKESMNLKKILTLMSDRNTFVALFGITLYGAGYGVFLTIIPAFLIGQKGFNQTLIGVYFSLFYVAISLSQIITGHFSDKIGREIFMILGLIVAALGVGIFPGLGHPFITIILALAGLGLGVFYLASMAFLNEQVPNSLKGTISGAYYLFWGIGFFLGPIVVGRLGELPGFNKGFIIFSMALVVEVVTMIFFYRKKIIGGIYESSPFGFRGRNHP